MQDIIINYGVAFAYYGALLAFAILALSFLVGTFTNLKSSLPFVIGVLVMLGIFFAFYSSQSGEFPDWLTNEKINKDAITSGVLKFVGGGVILSLILIAVAAVSMFLDMVVSFFK